MRQIKGQGLITVVGQAEQRAVLPVLFQPSEYVLLIGLSYHDPLHTNQFRRQRVGQGEWGPLNRLAEDL